MINKEPSQVKYQKAEMLGVTDTGPVALLSADMGLPVRVEQAVRAQVLPSLSL